MNKNTHGIWAEKYRPTSIESFIGEESLKNTMQQFVNNKNIPHLLFHSEKPGVGKTSLAKILVTSIECDSLYINASDNNGVDFIREKIKPFAQSYGNCDLKIIILDEFDFTTPNFQAALRNLMETTSDTTRFILTCNYISKIIDPIISRCQVFKITPTSPKEVAQLLLKIVQTENIEHSLEDLGSIIVDHYPDIRKIINTTQQFSVNGTLQLIHTVTSCQNVKNKLIDIIKNSSSNNSSFNMIRQVIVDSGIKIYEELYEELYKHVDEFGNNKVGEIIEIIADSIYKSNFVIDKEIIFMSCINRILNILNKKNNIL